MWFEDEGVGECRVAECVDDVEYWTAKRIVSFGEKFRENLISDKNCGEICALVKKWKFWGNFWKFLLVFVHEFMCKLL